MSVTDGGLRITFLTLEVGQWASARMGVQSSDVQARISVILLSSSLSHDECQSFRRWLSQLRVSGLGLRQKEAGKGGSSSVVALPAVPRALCRCRIWAGVGRYMVASPGYSIARGKKEVGCAYRT